MLATTIANWTTAALLAWPFRIRRHIVDQWQFVLALIVAGVAMVGILVALSAILRMSQVFGVFAISSEVAFTTLTALTAYSTLLLWFHVPEALQLRRYAMKWARRAWIG
ncbi:MAG: hypothetical protein C7B45_13195 [Sulfobacillus acidophilus]|uniref:Uncharacterized protein n=1 Tax=Sulfobacillus acidophilus TaxID=53633 RepID=A0A2T2WF34_9FIRM|nr:MAG: hypothetical protein C7B45_13195 [Sulfobacillus acidophilus]